MAEQRKNAVNKQQVLQDLLAIAKKNKEISVEQIERASHLLELDEAQNQRIYAALEKLGVRITGREPAIPAAAEKPVSAKKAEKAAEKETPELAKAEKEQILQTLLEKAKKSGRVCVTEIGKAVKALDLDGEQQNRFYTALAKMNVEIVQEEEAFPTEEDEKQPEIQEEPIVKEEKKAKPREKAAKAEKTELKKADKQQILQELLEKAKKNGKVDTKELAQAIEALDLDDEQQSRFYAALEKMGVMIDMAEDDLPDREDEEYGSEYEITEE